MSSFINDIELLASPKSVFKCCNMSAFPTYEQFLPFTELTVSLVNDATERDLGRIDMFTACDFLLKRELSAEAMLTAIMYINRYKRRKEVSTNNRLSSFTSADLFLISMMLASKYLFDDGTEKNVVNEEWAEDFGIENEEINALEIDFLNAVDWRLHVESKEFIRFQQKLCSYLAHKLWMSHEMKGSTYRELFVMHSNLNDLEFTIDKLVQVVVKAIVGCVVVYFGIIVSVHLFVFVVTANPSIFINQHWNMIDYHRHPFSSDFPSNVTKESFVYNDINESRNYHSTSSYSFVIGSKILSRDTEQ